MPAWNVNGAGEETGILPEAMDAGRVFDEVVHYGAHPSTLLGEEEGEVAWEIVALPRSAAPPDSLPPGALVIERALGEGRLGSMRVLREDIQPQRLYGVDGRIRPDVLVLAPRRAARPVAAIEADEDRAAAPEIEAAEAVPLHGRGRFRHEPLGGAEGPNVEARWNVDATTPAGATIDVVVHLHGYGQPRSDFLARKAAAAGVDLADGSGAVRVRASRPTLALVPRGRHGTGPQWFFDALRDRAALDALVDAGLSWLATTVLRLPAGSGLTRGRLTLMAHSGGGAGLSTLLARGVDPDEVVCFDSMYAPGTSILSWAAARIASPAAARSGLRVFYTGCSAPSREHPAGRWVRQPDGTYAYRAPGSWTYRKGSWRLVTTEVFARRLHHALEAALAGTALASRFRVEQTSVGHNDIPARYSPPLLEDIAANVPGATSPPPASRTPACVANDDWLRHEPRKPGGTDPPPPRPSATAEELEVEDVYAPPDARAYTPSARAAAFRVAPGPVAVSPATQWPEATADPDAACQAALRALGVDSTGVAAYAGAGLAALRPIAAVFGEAALIELLGRLRYSPAQLARPPHSYGNAAALSRAFGRPVAREAILAVRTLPAIPGHFRQLARRAGTDQEAYALENLGWLLMQSLREEVRRSSGIDFWMPDPPSFVGPFANPVPGLSPQATRLVVGRTLIDTSLDPARYTARYEGWRSGPAGRTWRLETGRESAAAGAGAPFYREAFTIPASVDISSPRAQVRAAWDRRVAAFDAGTTTVPLTRCDNSYLAALGLMARISLRGLQLRSRFPARTTAPAIPSLTGLAAVRPAFEGVFQAIADVGWNDLLFETQGMGCFRGKKIPGSPSAARRMSEHSLGIAIDVNVFENAQNTPGSMDPRIVALFEAFRFRWGRGFSTPDPMHFEYAG